MDQRIAEQDEHDHYRHRRSSRYCFLPANHWPRVSLSRLQGESDGAGFSLGGLRESYEWRNIPPCHLYWATGKRQ